MKKAQTQMVFIFILAAIVIGLIVIMGYKGITSLTGSSEKVMIDDFINSLESDINSLERLKGSLKTRNYRLPTSVHKVCFVKSCDISTSGECTSTVHAPEVPSTVTSIFEQNVYLVGTDDAILGTEKFTNVEIYNQIDGVFYQSFCLDNKGKITIKIRGEGNGVTIMKG